MKRAIAVLLACLLLFSSAFAEEPEIIIDDSSTQETDESLEYVEEIVISPDVDITLSDDASPTLTDEGDAGVQVMAPEEAGQTVDPTNSGEEGGDGLQQPSEPEEAPEPTVISIKKNKTRTVYLGTVYRFKVTGKKVRSYSSSSKKIATVNKTGLITLKKTGKVKITAKLKSSGKKVVLTLKVADPLVPASVSVDQGESVTMQIGDTFPLTATVSPATAPQDVTWSSGNSRVATVDENGTVTAVDWGRATITASTPNKKTASFTVVVKKPITQPYMISHAMGGIDGIDYTNSLEAFQENYAEGHRVFEVDFEYTSDGKLVLNHDWRSKRSSAQTSKKATTYKKFMRSKINKKYTPLDLEDLLRLMKEYPDIIIITDTKYTDTATIKKQFKTIVKTAKSLGDESVLDRMVVEIYNKKMYSTVESIHHFNDYIFTLYKIYKNAPSKSQLKNIAAFCQKNRIRTIAMKVKWWKTSFVSVLNTYDIDMGLYTTNSQSQAKKLIGQGVTTLWTDYLPPLDN